jgi:tripartite-type tricarboxylate transporter receptor subunit TctC
VVTFWQGMVVPAGTPQAIVEKLQKAIAKVAADPEDDRTLQAARGGDPRLLTGGVQGLHEPEEVRWVKLIKERNIKPE